MIPRNLFSQIVQDLTEILKEMAGDVLINAIGVKGSFGKDEICLLGCASVRETIAHKKDGIVLLSVKLNQLLFTGSAAAAFLVGVRKGIAILLPFKKLALIGIKGNFGKMMYF